MPAKARCPPGSRRAKKNCIKARSTKKRGGGSKYKRTTLRRTVNRRHK